MCHCSCINNSKIIYTNWYLCIIIIVTLLFQAKINGFKRAFYFLFECNLCICPCKGMFCLPDSIMSLQKKNVFQWSVRTCVMTQRMFNNLFFYKERNKVPTKHCFVIGILCYMPLQCNLLFDPTPLQIIKIIMFTKIIMFLSLWYPYVS